MTTVWAQQDVEAVTRCVVCGGERLAPLYTDLRAHDLGGWRLLRCAGCGSGLLDPRPTPDAIGKAYDGEYVPYKHRPARPAPTGRRDRARRAVADAYLARRWGYAALPARPALSAVAVVMPSLRRASDRLVRFAAAPPAGGARLLDVGCATGAYIELMRSLGWDTHGLEMDQGAVETARGLGLSVRQGMMSDLDPGVDGTFDHITVGHVIEHTHEPVEALEAAFRVLRPGGRIWVGTPNLGSLGARLFRSRWRALEPPRHLVLFTPDSLSLALRAAGFSDIRVVRARPSARWHFERSAQLAGLRRRRLIRAAARGVNAAGYVRPSLSDEVTIVATRAGDP
jgi:2-polyprenyl-3-methyl-5-hydroxy-6-metoxy-1,4-benzoquinol methylase